MKRLGVAALACVVPLAAEAQAAADPSAPASPFTVQRPRGWTALGVQGPSDVSLMRPDMPFHGPIQPHGQARLNVAPTVARPRTLRASLAAYARDGAVTGMRELRVAGVRGPCGRMTEQTVREVADPSPTPPPDAPALISTELFCVTPRTVFVGVLTVWSDERQPASPRVLIRTMASLRPTPSQAR